MPRNPLNGHTKWVVSTVTIILLGILSWMSLNAAEVPAIKMDVANFKTEVREDLRDIKASVSRVENILLEHK